VKIEQEESPKTRETKSSHSSHSQPKFQKLNFNNGAEKQKDNKSTNGETKSVSLIDFQENEGISNGKAARIDFNEFEEAPTQSSSYGTSSSSSFSFINKTNGSNNNNTNNYNSSLIDLNSSENIKDVKFKEASDSIFKLYTQGEIPVVDKNKVNTRFPQGNNSINNSYPHNPQNNHNYQHHSGYNNSSNNGYSNNSYQQNINNNLFRNNYSYPMTANNNLHSSDLFNKNSFESGSKMSNTFGMNNIDMTTLKMQGNKEKNTDPFKNLVNFK